jgi:hypothetical protein
MRGVDGHPVGGAGPGPVQHPGPEGLRRQGAQLGPGVGERVAGDLGGGLAVGEHVPRGLEHRPQEAVEELPEGGAVMPGRSAHEGHVTERVSVALACPADPHGRYGTTP